MNPLQADPVRDLAPSGGALVGWLVPALVLLASIAVSWLLFRHFVRRRASARAPPR